ncbi:MAG: hypothetical protein ACOYJF_01065 [Prevotella sp.]
MNNKIIAVRRDDRYSPNSVEKDRSILLNAVEKLRKRFPQASLKIIDERDLPEFTSEIKYEENIAYVVLSMARSEDALQALNLMEQNGALVVNSAKAVSRCQRSVLDRIMRNNNVAMPPLEGTDGYWLKRGDAAAQERGDVVFCSDTKALEAAKENFRRRGITNWVTSAHVVGDVVKFYGVGNRFFRYFYPTDDHITKFGDEIKNGEAHHYFFSEQHLSDEARRLASIVGLNVFGGDAVVRADGTIAIIDFNDWPSFSRCCEDAAEAIAAEIMEKWETFSEGDTFPNA